jgi:hypothetical protein
MVSTLNLQDQYVREDAAPVFTAGWLNSFAYKSITLTIMAQGAKQRGVSYLYYAYSSPPGYYGHNVPVQLENIWRNPGDVSGLEKYTTGATDPSAANGASFFTRSSGVWRDASYIRLKTVALSYKLPASLLKRVHCQAASLFVNGQNLLIISGYKPGDPETQSLYAFPLQRTIVAGINLNF